MLSKLVFRNIRKSFKDYAIYFLTLVIGVCVFYMFNSIYEQGELMSVTKTTHEAMQSLQQILSYISIFVAIVLGFLIIYANRFFIKRRKKELGIYMSLGMLKSRISTILVLETSMIAIIALVIGLLLGVFGSQFMSVFTAKIFEADMSKFKFIFSLNAVVKSIFYFGIIFLVVMIFNVRTVSKCKLIDLIYGGKHNENVVFHKFGISIVIFIISIFCLGSSYILIIKNGILELNLWFMLSILMGTIGTILFFFSLSEILIKLIQKNKKLYYKNLNMFVVRQIGSKINTNFLSVSVVCIVLLITIGVFSSGYSMQNVLSNQLREDIPYDFSIFEYKQDEEANSIWENLPDNIKNYEGIVYWDEYAIREINYTYKDFNFNLDNKHMYESKFKIISLSDYNEILESQGKKPLELNKNNYSVIFTDKNLEPVADQFIKENISINIDNTNLTPVNTTESVSLSNSSFLLTLVVDDIYTKNLPTREYVLNIRSKDEQSSQILEDMITSFRKQSYKETKTAPFVYFLSKRELYESSITTKAMVSFLSIYLGFVFMIVCASILAIQQLSEASDNKERYELLKKLGAEEKVINKALFTQILCYFLFPLLLAVVHSIVGLTVANDVIKRFGEIDVTKSILATACFIVLIYGIYFVLTYVGSKSMIKENK